MSRKKRPAHNRQPQPVRYKGRTYGSILKLCRAHKVSPSSFNFRRRQGLSLAQALKPWKGREHYRPQALSIGPKHFKSAAAACRHLKIPYWRYGGRRQWGWSIKQALGLAPAPRSNFRPKRVRIGLRTYSTLTEVAKAYGITRNTLSMRLRRGWSLKRALAPARMHLKR